MKYGLFVFFLAFSMDLLAQTTPIPDRGAPLELQLFTSNPKANDLVEIGFLPPSNVIRNMEAYFLGLALDRAVNPFDPEDLDIRAYFQLSGKEQETNRESRFGFYFQDYERNTASPDPNNWKHILVTTPYILRGRFSPPDAGSYQCWMSISTKNGFQATTDTLIFQVSESNLKPPISLADGKVQFQRGEEGYFPVGQNIPWPFCDSACFEPCKQVRMAQLESYTSDIMGPPGFIAYEKLLDAYGKHGGNYFRMLVAPWNLEVEFEELGNYKDRMHCAWELDRMLDKALENDLLCHLNLQVHYPLEFQSSYAMWQWDYNDIDCFPYDDPYCYFDELDLPTPMDFLKSDVAKKHYQNRLRYYIARYGDHPGLGIVELLSESNNIGNASITNENCEIIAQHGKSPYDSDPENTRALFLWHKNMADFIKEDLGYQRRPLAVSYTGPPNFLQGDSTYYISSVDVATFNHYSSALETFSGMSQLMDHYQNGKGKDQSNFKPPAFKKAFIHSEIGPGILTNGCDEDVRFYKNCWMSAFSGMSASALNWDYQFDTLAWKHLERIDSIHRGINLINEPWKSEFDISKNKKMDLVVLKKSKGKRQAKGVIHNRTYNFYTVSPNVDNPCKRFVRENPQLFPEELLSKHQPVWNKRKDKLVVKDMGALRTYVIRYMDIQTGSIVLETKRNTGLDGHLTLPYMNTFDAEHPIYFFEVLPN